jgi:biotin carboxylase
MEMNTRIQVEHLLRNRLLIMTWFANKY